MMPMKNRDLRDLLVIVADATMKVGVSAILSRPAALGIRPITFDIYTHPEHDPGCRFKGASFSRLFLRQYSHCLLMFDFEGCGKEDTPVLDLEKQIDQDLESIGWKGNAKTIIIDPELEIWVWSDSEYVDDILSWRNRTPSLRDFLIERGFIQSNKIKPIRPKEALELALRTVKIPRSSDIYKSLAENVSFQKCQDLAFNRFRSTLIKWFPIN